LSAFSRMGLPQSLCADDRWLRMVNELEIAIELTMGSLGDWSAIRKLVRDGVFEKSVEEIVVRKLVIAEKTTLSSSY
jgi:hypothetical protein